MKLMLGLLLFVLSFITSETFINHCIQLPRLTRHINQETGVAILKLCQQKMVFQTCMVCGTQLHTATLDTQLYHYLLRTGPGMELSLQLWPVNILHLLQSTMMATSPSGQRKVTILLKRLCIQVSLNFLMTSHKTSGN